MVADYFQRIGLFPHAESVTGAATGRDVTGTPGLAVEVKATSSDPLLAGLRQAARYAGTGEVPLVVWRPNGYGEAQIEAWVMAFTLEHGVALLEAAGFGGRGPKCPTCGGPE